MTLSSKERQGRATRWRQFQLRALAAVIDIRNWPASSVEPASLYRAAFGHAHAGRISTGPSVGISEKKAAIRLSCFAAIRRSGVRRRFGSTFFRRGRRHNPLRQAPFPWPQLRTPGSMNNRTFPAYFRRRSSKTWSY